ncbi:MAG: squalene synthase HpnC [Gemmataceae bacterium]|nr:squalene synthase HpnC [Gemmataceae bacterium]
MGWDFRRQLALFGPGHAPASPAQAARYCRWAAHAHYENFSVASLLLPRRLLRHFHAVYAYCRWADDLGDETGERAPELLSWWRGELERMHAGEATHPVFVALRATVERYRIPPDPFRDLLSAFEQDQRVKRYATHEELLGYCARSANPVGRLVLHLWECHGPRTEELSDHVCTGLQEANFWQDVARDFAIGRVYLPQEDMDRFGVTEEDIAARRATPAFRELMRFQVGRTRARLEAGRPLVDLVPPAVRAEMGLFLAGGLGILSAIERAGYDVLSSRPALSKWEKGKLVLAALWWKLAGGTP